MSSLLCYNAEKIEERGEEYVFSFGRYTRIDFRFYGHIRKTEKVK